MLMMINMTPEIENLLSVLDMSEEEQFEWCAKNNLLGGNVLHTDRDNMYLADLAFRMRDEAVKKSKKHYRNALFMVFRYVTKIKYSITDYRMYRYVAEYFRPIDIIIAAEIARSK